MVQLERAPDDVEGMLSLDERTLRFEPTERSGIRTIDLPRRPARSNGWWAPRSCSCTASRTASSGSTAFYFSKPPPLHPDEPDAR